MPDFPIPATLRCPAWNKRFAAECGQFTFSSQRATINGISTYTVWKMRLKLFYAFEQKQKNTLLSDEIELDEISTCGLQKYSNITYNLDMILAAGYCAKSSDSIIFR